MLQLVRAEALSSLHGAVATPRAEWRERRAEMEALGLRSTPRGTAPKSKFDAVRFLSGLAGHAFRATGLYSRGVRNLLSPRLRMLAVRLPGLPAAFDGFRILQISDPHFDIVDGLAEAIAGLVRGVKADVCLFTGDYRAKERGSFGHALESLSLVKGALGVSDGVYAVLGNHDSYEMVPAMETLGIRVLTNETQVFERRGRTLSLTGLDDVYRYFTDKALEVLRQAGPFDADAFGLAVVHSPDMMHPVSEQGFGLYLCGHTHGGQICLPGGFPAFTRTDVGRRFASGLWSYRGMRGFTSNGVGASVLPLRFYCPGEVALITLRAGSPGSHSGWSKPGRPA